MSAVLGFPGICREREGVQEVLKFAKSQGCGRDWFSQYNNVAITALVWLCQANPGVDSTAPSVLSCLDA